MKNWIITLSLFFTIIILPKIKAQTCYVPDVQLYEWNTQQNTLPRFVVACLQKEGLGKEAEESNAHRGFVIFLGQTSQGVYTIEGGQASDATEHRAGFASLAFTPFKGTREVFALYNNQSMDQLTEEIVLKKLWKLHKYGIYQVSQLKPINFIQNPVLSKPNLQIADTVRWMYKTANPAQQVSIVWNLKAKSSMCWCEYQ